MITVHRSNRFSYIFTDYITWAKTNQINATIATGRTGHWLNHMKETCLVGLKGKPKLNAGLDSNVIVERIRETSRKPDAVCPTAHLPVDLI
jgi:mRNA (2'-O-methyladenosine-N6-)-methyltransferase